MCHLVRRKRPHARMIRQRFVLLRHLPDYWFLIQRRSLCAFPYSFPSLRQFGRLLVKLFRSIFHGRHPVVPFARITWSEPSTDREACRAQAHFWPRSKGAPKAPQLSCRRSGAGELERYGYRAANTGYLEPVQSSPDGGNRPQSQRRCAAEYSENTMALRISVTRSARWRPLTG